MSVQSGRPDHSLLEAQRRRQLIQSAIECVAEVGIERTTMRMVAERAGFTTGMLLYYFRNKRDLMSSAIEFANADFRARLDSLTNASFGPARIEAILSTFLRDSPSGVPRSFLLQFWAAALVDPELREISLLSYQQAIERNSQSIRAGRESGELRPDLDDQAAAELVHALMYGLASHLSLFPELLTPDRVLALARMVLQSFASESKTALILTKEASTLETVEDAIRRDPSLDAQSAADLLESFRATYRLARHDRTAPTDPLASS